MAWSAGCRRGPPDVGAVATLSSPSSTAPSFGCCPRKACRLSPSDGQPSLWLHGCPSSRDVRAPAGTEKAVSGPVQPCQPPALQPTQAPSPGGCGISLCQYSLKSWMAAFLMAQHGEPRPCSARAIMGVAWHSTAPPSPAPRTSVCSTWRAHTWGEHRGLMLPCLGKRVGQDRGAKRPSAPRLDSMTRAVGFCLLSSHSLTLGTWHSSGDPAQITLSPKRLQQPGVPHSPAGGRGSGPSPVAVLWQPRSAGSGCSGSGAAVPVPGPRR